MRLTKIVVLSLMVPGLYSACTSTPREAPTTSGQVSFLSPEGLHKNPVYSQVAVVSGNTRTVYVGGQNSVDPQGNVIGKGDLKAQTQQALRNVQTALVAAGAEPKHVVKLNVYVVQGQSLQAGLEAFQQTWGAQPSPPTISVLFVAGLAHPDFLVEIDAIGVVPRD